ncbi:hypothetical protein VH570_01295 [Sphingobium sp. HT1-2]|uniref:hypothetical protein n=1 Tax=Sphingobium sp. HT1-2 TaxID=3111640 RepID=UPI003C0E9133
MKPNAETIAAMQDADLTRYASLEDMFVDLDREQRLAELLAEFEAAVEALGPTMWPIDSPDQMAGLWLLQFDSQTLADEARTAARRYIIARDNGIFDDSWEVMWKLRFGGAV